MREYTRMQTLAANVPYAAMTLLGAGTIALGFGLSPWALAGAGAYFAYGIAGAFWIMIFVCPYCAYHGTRGCPCGYGTVSARLARKGAHNCFAEKFKRHIPAIVPLWLIPVACGGAALWGSFSWGLAAAVLAFSVNSYVVLPLVSRTHSCSDCPQKDDCPWMGRKAQTA
ncbi:MAG: hypothetical protein NTW86_04710 [Candidatus Sumerlaeota bacterium]|nr:hypothetical protein [Candidatus Sumerlaeota bacterium]